MGELIKQPIYGNDCGFLTPGIFAAGFTPENMLASMFDLEPCPLAGGDSAPNGSVVLTQGANCVWEGLLQGKTVHWEGQLAHTLFNITEGLDQWFLHRPMIVGEDEFTNTLLACGGIFDFGIKGTAQVSLDPYEANSYELAVSFNFVPPDETYFTDYMVNSASPFTKVTRLSSHRWNTNVLIKRNL